MTPSTHDFERSVVKRLERLEVQNRRLKGALVLLAALAGVGLLMGQAPRVAKHLEAENFILRDAVGRARASLTTVDAYPGLMLLDENKKTRASFFLTKKGPALEFYDTNAQRRLSLSTQGDESLIMLADQHSHFRIGLMVREDAAGVQIRDENNKVLFSQP